ncbi:hypothetical protein PSP31121_00342 [Pandoraea sputorum]|uniref:Copper resistance protein B n=2 Tax=Pandoraea sputorum TaxID=93222 RepID=A0A5E5AN25_9BURK|nr:hypothetical protein PSP31121_00342 [Pandoraea sputorum]
MMFLSLRRHALCLPVVLSLWGVSPLAAVAAEPATTMVASDDPASPDAPAGPLPAAVLSDFARPALSVATSDWRMANAGVSGMPGMSGSGHDMPSHSGHAMNPPARTGHEAMGHAMPMAPSSAPVAPGHENMGHAMPMTSPPGMPVDPHAGHGGQGALQ